MSNTKLTLTVKPEIVQMAKQYARRHHTSVSAMFSRVIREIVVKEQDRAMAIPAGSALEKLCGITKLPEGKTADDVLLEALLEKYGLEDLPKRGH
jgi:hypothetical protein